MKKVLLLEENSDGRRALAKVLRSKGFQVFSAPDTCSAIDAVGSGRPLDLLIAGATGCDRSELLADVRQLRPELPVIFLTDYRGPDYRLRSLILSAFGMARPYNLYINLRPIAIQELSRMIRIALRKPACSMMHKLAA